MLGLLTAFGLAACDDSSDLGIQQQNPQEAIMEANGLTVAWQSPIQGNTLSLPAYKDQAIPVISTVETKDLPAGATIDYEMQIASNADFSDAQTVAVENGAVLESDWDNAFKAIYHKDPAARVNYIRFAAYVIDGSQVSRLGGDDFDECVMNYLAAGRGHILPLCRRRVHQDEPLRPAPVRRPELQPHR